MEGGFVDKRRETEEMDEGEESETRLTHTVDLGMTAVLLSVLMLFGCAWLVVSSSGFRNRTRTLVFMMLPTCFIRSFASSRIACPFLSLSFLHIPSALAILGPWLLDNQPEALIFEPSLHGCSKKRRCQTQGQTLRLPPVC